MTSIFVEQANVASHQNFTKTEEITYTKGESLSKGVPTNLSSQEYLREIENLKKTIKALEAKQDVLEVEKEELVNQVSDLKALMKRVGQECDKNLQRAEEKNRALTHKVKSLEKALEVSFNHTGHLDDMIEFWKDME